MDPDQNPLGILSPLACPDCRGAMRPIRDGKVQRCRCQTGHAFSVEFENGRSGCGNGLGGG